MATPDPFKILDNLVTTRTIHDASSLSAPITTVGLGSARWVEWLDKFDQEQRNAGLIDAEVPKAGLQGDISTREGPKSPKQFEALDNLIKQTILDTTPPTSIGLGSVKWVEWLDTFNEEHINIQAGLGANVDSTKEAGLLNANLDTLSISKESLHVPAMNAGESPIKWTHWSELKILEEENPIEWADDETANSDLLSQNPVKFTQSQCTKCNRKFFSNINLRRHVRASHDSPSEVTKENVDKMKIQVAAYWDQLSQEQACNLVDRDELSLPALPMRHLFDTLIAQLEISDVLGIPPAFYNSALCIMDAMEDMPTRYPINSREWLVYLGVLSENNLFWGGTNLPSEMQSLFDNDPQRVGQDGMNTFASLALLVESALVKAWDKHQRSREI